MTALTPREALCCITLCRKLRTDISGRVSKSLACPLYCWAVNTVYRSSNLWQIKAETFEILLLLFSACVESWQSVNILENTQARARRWGQPSSMLVRNSETGHAMHPCFQQRAQKQQDVLQTMLHCFHVQKHSWSGHIDSSWDSWVLGSYILSYCNKIIIMKLSCVLKCYFFVTFNKFGIRFQIKRSVNEQMIPEVVLTYHIHLNQLLTFSLRISFTKEVHLISRILWWEHL